MNLTSEIQTLSSQSTVQAPSQPHPSQFQPQQSSQWCGLPSAALRGQPEAGAARAAKRIVHEIADYPKVELWD